MRDYAQKLARLRADLETYYNARTQIITTGQSWQLRNGDDNRSIQNVSLAQLNALIAKTERDIAALEEIVENKGKSPNGVRVRANIL